MTNIHHSLESASASREQKNIVSKNHYTKEDTIDMAAKSRSSRNIEIATFLVIFTLHGQPKPLVEELVRFATLTSQSIIN